MPARPPFSRLLVLAGVLFVLSGSEATAQDAPMKWGDVPEEHLTMRAFPADTNASAVVLGDFGEVTFRRDGTLLFERHRRVKLLREAGYALATAEFILRDAGQKLRNLDGHTLLPGADGRPRRVKLDGDAIFREDVDGTRTRVRFTLPALEPGAVVEYRYTIEAESPGAFPDWTFQSTEPTLWSEFRAEVPQYLRYVRIVQGVPAFAVEEVEEEAFDPEAYFDRAAREAQMRSGSGRERLAETGGMARREQQTNDYRWAVADVPALRDEAYVTTLNDHVQKIRFQLAGYYDGYGVLHPVMTTWEDLARRLREEEDFGGRLHPRGAVRERGEALTSDDATATLQAVYDEVRSGIVWDGTYRLFAERDLDAVLASKRGSGAEVNLLLIAMLRAAGVEAFPVLVSTRAHGQVLPLYPFYDQFDHVVAVAVADGRGLFLDATDPHRPAGVLPVAALNGQGWLVTEDAARWVPLPAPGHTGTALFVAGALGSDGTLGGTVNGRLAGYAALDARRDLEEAAAPAGAALDAPDALAFSEVEVQGLEGDGQIVLDAAFEAPGHGQAVAHLLTFSPFLLSGLDENPFQQPERAYPVDFAYPFSESYTAEIALPDGYAVDEAPPPLETAMPGGAGSYRRSVTVEGRTLHVQRQLQIAEARFEPEAYDVLRAFFDEVAAADAEVVVLVQADPEASADAEGEHAEDGR